MKFNESLAFNKNLRERIDTLRRERVVFDSIYKKLERELHEKKKVANNQCSVMGKAEITLRGGRLYPRQNERMTWSLIIDFAPQQCRDGGGI